MSTFKCVGKSQSCMVQHWSMTHWRVSSGHSKRCDDRARRRRHCRCRGQEEAQAKEGVSLRKLLCGGRHFGRDCRLPLRAVQGWAVVPSVLTLRGHPLQWDLPQVFLLRLPGGWQLARRTGEYALLLHPGAKVLLLEVLCASGHPVGQSGRYGQRG